MRTILATLMFVLHLSVSSALAGPPSPGLDVTVIVGQALATVDNPLPIPRDVVGIALLRSPDGRVHLMEYHGAPVTYLPGVTIVALGDVEIDNAAPGVTMIEVALLDPVTGETLARVIRPVGVRP